MKLTEENADQMDCRPYFDKNPLPLDMLPEHLRGRVAAGRAAAAQRNEAGSYTQGSKYPTEDHLDGMDCRPLIPADQVRESVVPKPMKERLLARRAAARAASRKGSKGTTSQPATSKE